MRRDSHIRAAHVALGTLTAALLAFVLAIATADQRTPQPTLRRAEPSIAISHYEWAYIQEHLGEGNTPQGTWLAERVAIGVCPRDGDAAEVLWSRADQIRTYILARHLDADGEPNAEDWRQVLAILNHAELCR